jgi:hypothetical protein
LCETPPVDIGHQQTAERVNIGALISRKVKLKCINEENKTMLINNIIETPHSLITGLPGLIKLNKDGIAFLVIQNCTHYAI